MAGKTDYYETLDVSKGSSGEEIKKAYRKKALEWHPDRHKGEGKEDAERKFKEINEAYQILSDPQKKAAYDQYGHSAFSPGGAASGFDGGGPFGSSQGGQWGPFTYTYSTRGGEGSQFSGFDFGDPFEIFESFFGGGSPFGRAQRKPRYSITVDFMEAVEGTEKTVDIGGKKRKIKIPAGISEGTRIDFGDFTLSVDTHPHPIFERDGDDIYVKEVIPFSLAALGGEIEVPTVSGKVKIRVRPGTQSGTTVRLKDQGVKHLRGSGKGDQYVRLNVLVPEKLTHEQKDVIEDLRGAGL